MTVLILSSRGANSNTRYLIKDICKFIKCEEEIKYDIKSDLKGLIELMDLHSTKHIIYFETTKRNEAVWVAGREGPSVKFNVFNIFTMGSLKFPVNCFKETGHVLLFSEDFDMIDELKIVKSLFTNVFDSNEVKERALCFFYVDSKIWIRNYVISEKELQEIGPRMVLEIDTILKGCYSGEVAFSKKVEDARKEMEQKIESE
ncbi:Brix domain-containing protein 2 [Nosema bombycis CQ1]|uniref:Brix domain-containing protein 2 n=1 Tax=Nosema bombycis (strain CQ1 / CVCC 102059) TaxID=578461 RepID=R0M3U7_NOSB1|nr:Brix domain-containing protein 2 [Nosema bombycis CQ1]|eukprot:EOB12704.1 Brix domain-containing protein 2 [Nosema bombycis CQ1]